MTDQIKYLLCLADNALILGHRNSEWCGHGPVLEQDIALTNISLDLIGQARNFYQYAASLSGADHNEDTLAYHRDSHEFLNTLLVEQPNGDWGVTILRQFLVSNYQYYLYQQLQHNSDVTLAAIAAKAIKEVTYHLRWSSEWVIRLGDGTTESNQRMQQALHLLWPFTYELLQPADYETGYIDVTKIKQLWQDKTNEILAEATLSIPNNSQPFIGGKTGAHSEHLTAILNEMQSLPRAYPNTIW